MLKDCHSQEPGFFIHCSLCARKFRVYKSFTSHVSRSHPGVTVERAFKNVARSIINQPFQEPSEYPCESMFVEQHDPIEESIIQDQQSTTAVNIDVTCCAGNFILGLKEKHLVSTLSYCVRKPWDPRVVFVTHNMNC